MTMEGKENQISKNIWLADSGASSHMTNSDFGLFNVKVIDSKIKIGDGKYIKVEKMGSLKLSFLTKENTKTIITLTNVKYTPQICVNLLSIPAALENGYHIGNHGLHLYLFKGDFKLTFNKLYKTGKNSVCGIELYPVTQETAYPILEPGTQLKTSDLHELLGHCGEDATRNTAKFYGWKITAFPPM
jgi:hypothetical protein